MPAQSFAILLLSVIAMAGVTIVAVLALGVNPVWLGILATVAAVVVRLKKW